MARRSVNFRLTDRTKSEQENKSLAEFPHEILDLKKKREKNEKNEKKIVNRNRQTELL